MAGERKHQPVFPGFRDVAARRQALTAALLSRRIELGLSQTEVAARMGTSQSAVARVEAGQGDLLMSTVQRYAAAVGDSLDWQLSPEAGGHADALGAAGLRAGTEQADG